MVGYFKQGRYVEYPYLKPREVTLDDVDTRLGRIEDIILRDMRYHADVHFKNTSKILVSGVINGRTYVNEFEVPPESLPKLIETLRYISKTIPRGHIDVPMGYESIFNKEIFL